MPALIDLTGKRFKRLIVIERTRLNARRAYWLCRCDCGNEKVVQGHHLNSGHTGSCGCFSKLHGLTFTPEHKAWCSLIERCYTKTNKGYPEWGGRGIRVCDRWRFSFSNFLADVGPRPSSKYSIDRFPDNDGNYEPGNVRWATKKQQARNRRSTKLSDEAVAEIKKLAGTKLQREIADQFGVGQNTISRVLSGVRWG